MTLHSLIAQGTAAGPAPIKRKREEASAAASTQQAKPQEGAPQPQVAGRDAEGSKAQGSSVGGPGKRRKRLEEAIGGLLQRREQSLESAGPARTPVRKASVSTGAALLLFGGKKGLEGCVTNEKDQDVAWDVEFHQCWTGIIGKEDGVIGGLGMKMCVLRVPHIQMH